jgi:CheY-like chemotaxis protein/anti-sigma regulatory factor (Ser/Thr protein kinase)
VLADEARIAQVFINVLVNAAQAIPEGRVDQNEIVVITDTDAEGRARICFRDTGIGIAPEHIHRIFEPFFTLKPVGVGSGLGLSIAHDIVTSFHGTINVESVVGKGTSVTVTLPALPARARVDQTTVAGRGRVLVVDDEDTIRSVARRMLASEHEVTLAASGAEAMSLVERGARFDVILCDLMMPNVTGMELHAKLHAVEPDQARRMVFMTGGAFTTRASTFLDGVANERIMKPLPRSAELRALVRKYVDQKV